MLVTNSNTIIVKKDKKLGNTDPARSGVIPTTKKAIILASGQKKSQKPNITLANFYVNDWS